MRIRSDPDSDQALPSHQKMHFHISPFLVAANFRAFCQKGEEKLGSQRQNITGILQSCVRRFRRSLLSNRLLLDWIQIWIRNMCCTEKRKKSSFAKLFILFSMVNAR
jgi:hypothetical protein